MGAVSEPQTSLPGVARAGGAADPAPADRRANLHDYPVSDLPLPPGTPSYRRDQLAAWLYRNPVATFEEMTDLPVALRERLGSDYRAEPFVAVERFPSRDGSVRYLFRLTDGLRTEAVYMPYLTRKTVCVSSMVGCPAGCAFCATGALGFGRNLSRGEIVAQLTAVARCEGLPPAEIRNVVLMGMGEALLNYDAAVAAIRTMIDPAALALSPRRITLSTVGLPSRIRRLADEGLPLVLAVSLHAPDEETRRAIIPTAHAHSIADIVAALAYWQERGGRRVTIEYTLLRGVNDSRTQAAQLAELLSGLVAHVNLIPFNPWPGAAFKDSTAARREAFRSVLERRGVSVSVRFSRGRDAGGACGQLALAERRSGSGQ